MEGTVSALPSRTRVLAELLAEQLGIASGRVRLELEYLDGSLKFWWKHEKGSELEDPAKAP